MKKIRELDLLEVIMGIALTIAIIALIGIVYACQGKAKELPLIGKFKVIK